MVLHTRKAFPKMKIIRKHRFDFFSHFLYRGKGRITHSTQSYVGRRFRRREAKRFDIVQKQTVRFRKYIKKKYKKARIGRYFSTDFRFIKVFDFTRSVATKGILFRFLKRSRKLYRPSRSFPKNLFRKESYWKRISDSLTICRSPSSFSSSSLRTDIGSAVGGVFLANPIARLLERIRKILIDRSNFKVTQNYMRRLIWRDVLPVGVEYPTWKARRLTKTCLKFLYSRKLGGWFDMIRGGDRTYSVLRKVLYSLKSLEGEGGGKSIYFHLFPKGMNPLTSLHAAFYIPKNVDFMRFFYKFLKKRRFRVLRGRMLGKTARYMRVTRYYHNALNSNFQTWRFATRLYAAGGHLVVAPPIHYINLRSKINIRRVMVPDLSIDGRIKVIKEKDSIRKKYFFKHRSNNGFRWWLRVTRRRINPIKRSLYGTRKADRLFYNSMKTLIFSTNSYTFILPKETQHKLIKYSISKRKRWVSVANKWKGFVIKSPLGIAKRATLSTFIEGFQPIYLQHVNGVINTTPDYYRFFKGIVRT